MKTIVILTALFFGTLLQAQSEKKGSISAVVPNVNGTEGSVLFGLYTAENFMNSEPEYAVKAMIKEGKAIANFENVPEGTYAILVMHDKNGNEQMDFDANGMPLENYGSSARTLSYGPPNWEESKFVFDGTQKEFEIRF